MQLKYLIGLLLLLPAVASADNLQLTPLNKEQLTQQFSGYTFTVGPVAMLRHVYIADPIQMYFAPNGQLSAKWAKPLPNTAQTDTGIWWVSNNQICVKWKQ